MNPAFRRLVDPTTGALRHFPQRWRMRAYVDSCALSARCFSAQGGVDVWGPTGGRTLSAAVPAQASIAEALSRATAHYGRTWGGR